MAILAAVPTIAGMLMIVSGVIHSRDWRALLSVLLTHGILRYSLARGSARILPLVLVASGGLAIVAVLSRSGEGTTRTTVLAVPMLVTYAGMAVYVAVALKRGVRGKCGCFGDDELISGRTLARVVLLTAGACVAVVETLSWDTHDAVIGTVPAVAITWGVMRSRRSDPPIAGD